MKTADEAALVVEESQRQGRHEADLRRTLKAALLDGSVYFRGNDRSPGEGDERVSKAASASSKRPCPTSSRGSDKLPPRRVT